MAQMGCIGLASDGNSMNFVTGCDLTRDMKETYHYGEYLDAVRAMLQKECLRTVVIINVLIILNQKNQSKIDRFIYF